MAATRQAQTRPGHLGAHRPSHHLMGFEHQTTNWRSASPGGTLSANHASLGLHAWFCPQYGQCSTIVVPGGNLAQSLSTLMPVEKLRSVMGQRNINIPMDHLIEHHGEATHVKTFCSGLIPAGNRAPAVTAERQNAITARSKQACPAERETNAKANARPALRQRCATSDQDAWRDIAIKAKRQAQMMPEWALAPGIWNFGPENKLWWVAHLLQPQFRKGS
jgi:hypothetical protein